MSVLQKFLKIFKKKSMQPLLLLGFHWSKFLNASRPHSKREQSKCTEAVHLDSRKCTAAGINSCATVPSKVRASNKSTKTGLTCSSKSEHRVVCFG